MNASLPLGAHKEGEANLNALFDERLGVILQMGFDPLPSWEPQIQLVTTWLSRELLPDASDTLRQRITSGHGFNRQRALDSSIGEAIERVSGGFSSWRGYDEETSRLPLIELQRLPRFSEPELKHLDQRYGRLRPESINDCYPATELGSGERLRVPAQLVFCPYHPRPEEKLFWEPTTNGLASGPNSTKAQIAGLLEVIERDALAVSWLLKIPGQELSLRDALGADYGIVTHALLRGPVKIRLALISLDIAVPVCVAAIYNETSLPAVAFGAAAATGLREAAKKALCEAALVYYTLKLRLGVLNEARYDPLQSDPKTYQEHGMAWMHQEYASQSHWLFGNRATQARELPLTQPNKTLDDLLGTIRDAGYVAYGCDLTKPELTPAGWNVYRVIVPGLQPLNPGRYRRMLDSERLTKIHEWLHGAEQPLTIYDSVHPFC